MKMPPAPLSPDRPRDPLDAHHRSARLIAAKKRESAERKRDGALSINDLVGTIKGDNTPEGPPIYRIKSEPFREFLTQYERHILAYEAYIERGRTKELRASSAHRKLIAAIARVGFMARYGEVLELFRRVSSPAMGEMQPFLNPSFFQHPKESRKLFWKFYALAAREWRVKTRSGEGRRADARTAELHRLAEQEYRRACKSNPFATHPELCRAIAPLLHTEDWGIEAPTLENMLRHITKDRRKKRRALRKKHSR